MAQSPGGIKAKWNVGRIGIPENLIFGPWTGGLSNDGERVVLRDAAGAVADEVEYQLGFPWPTVGDPVSDAQPGADLALVCAHHLRHLHELRLERRTPVSVLK